MLAEVSPRTAAVLAGHEEVVDLLEAHGASLDFHDACYLGEAEHVQRRLDTGVHIASAPKPEGTDAAASAPVFYAVAGCQAQVLHRILEHPGCLQGVAGGLLLRWAAWRRSSEILELLLRKGLLPADSGITDWAIDPELRRLADAHGHPVDIDAPNWLGFPALVDACRGNHNQTDDPGRVLPILVLRASVHVRDHRGKTALHRASQAGFTRITQLLLEWGAGLDESDQKGETPLFDAVRAGRAGAVSLLIAAGADPDRLNLRGVSARDLAGRLGAPAGNEIRGLLSA